MILSGIRRDSPELNGITWDLSGNKWDFMGFHRIGVSALKRFELNRDELVRMITDKLLMTAGFEIYSNETEKELDQVEKYIRNVPFLDEGFKFDFELRVTSAVEGAALDAFETGLSVGISILDSLLNGSLREIIVHYKPGRKEETSVQYQQQTFESNPDFLEFMKRSDKYIDGNEKLRLMTTASFFMRKYFEEINLGKNCTRY